MSDDDRLAPFIEAMARAEHAYTNTFSTPGAKHPCPPALHDAENCPLCEDGYWTEGEPPSWEDDTEGVRESYRDEARRDIDAALAVDGPVKLIVAEVALWNDVQPMQFADGEPVYREVQR